MISCTEFIPAYSELFKFLEAQGGREAVEAFWEHLSDRFLGTSEARSSRTASALLDVLEPYPERGGGGLHNGTG